MTRIPIDDERSNDDQEPEEPDEAAAQAPDRDTRTAAADEFSSSALQADRDSLYERLARTTADFKNAQKRLQTESDQRVQYANSSLIKSLLPVIDNFERALAVDPAKVDARSILKGMQIVHDQWLNVLKQQQVREIAPEPGTPFDPTQHEAIMQQPSDKYDEGTVVQTFQKGYSLHDRTLRPAQVAVSKPK